ncbi:type II toxin-antitoxin system RelE/ParE family toxin [uncultured Thiodictyon sp.]|uniref:type II toxin-antitoxin system RelE family toxin n=1 Tax=uncultured Thiodictyon sp. TaxID=1846217 RepID=UPI0025E68BA0|nr:type II toxin-antitoxin system RelE/ParE family toxin [uncultured Thiodictyon sp.]
MAYRIEIKRNARKALLSLPHAYRSRIGEAIDSLASDPRKPGTRKLEGSESLYRLRVGDYRVIYEIQDARLIIVVVKVGHRREVYRDH